MTIKEIKQLVEETKHLSKDEIRNISDNLPFFDGVNYTLWMKEIDCSKLEVDSYNLGSKKEWDIINNKTQK